jgi:Protein of unknown function (DUF3024)
VAVPELAVAHIRRFCEKRTPADLRDEMRLEADVRGNSVTISDCRPPWDGSPGEWTRMRVAQLRFDPTTQRWTLHWADRNSRWHPYDDLAPTTNLDRVLAEIDRDPTCIFFG